VPYLWIWEVDKYLSNFELVFFSFELLEPQSVDSKILSCADNLLNNYISEGLFFHPFAIWAEKS